MKIKYFFTIFYIAFVSILLNSCGSSANNNTSEKINLNIKINNLPKIKNETRTYLNDINSITLDIIAQNNQDEPKQFELLDHMNNGFISLSVQLFTGITYDLTLKSYIYNDELYCEASDTLTPSISGDNTVNLNCELTPAFANQLPDVSFIYSSNRSEFVYINDNISFTNNSTDDGTYFDNCTWDFGDGTTITGCDTVYHTYSTSDNFTVTLTVTDDRGAVASSSQELTILPIFSFSTTYDAGYDEMGTNISKNLDDGYLISGINVDGSTVILNTDRYGSIKWQNMYSVGGSNTDITIFKTIETSDNGFLFCGTHNTGNTSDFEAFVGKLNSDGTVNWYKKFGDNSTGKSSTFYSAIELNNGNYLIAGATNSYNTASSNNEGWVVEIQPNGNTIKTYTFMPNSSDDIIKFFDLKELENGNILIGGNYYIFNDDTHSLLLLLNNNLDILKANRIDAIINTSESIHNIASLEANNNYFISENGILGKINDNISLIWAKQITDNSSNPMQLSYIKLINNSMSLITNKFDNNNYTNTPILLTLDSNGNKILEKNYLASSTDAMFTNLIKSYDNTYSITGYRNNGSNNDIWILKLDRNNNVENISTDSNITTAFPINITTSTENDAISSITKVDRYNSTNGTGTFDTMYINTTNFSEDSQTGGNLTSQ